MNPYRTYVAEYARLAEQGKKLTLGNIAPAPRTKAVANAPTAMIFAPHPDDECIIGGLALRLMREAGIKVTNVAVTLGSKKERQAERWRELQSACGYLGFELVGTGANGLERIQLKTREQDRAHWAGAVKVITQILEQQLPRFILCPHEQDWNSTHIGTHFLVMDALGKMRPDFECYLVETEFWGQMDPPNLMVELSTEDLAELVAGTSFHAGEVQRNPYHVLMPAWMMDNVRRGTELVGGQGGAAPAFTFATLYRVRKWSAGAVKEVWTGGKALSCNERAGELFP